MMQALNIKILSLKHERISLRKYKKSNYKEHLILLKSYLREDYYR